MAVLRALGLLLLLCLPAWAVAATALPAGKVLLVDSALVETATATLRRIKAEAAAHTPPLRQADIAQGVELALSEILTVLPEAVATVAMAQQADLVVQLSAWPETAVDHPADVTEQVIAEIDRRLAHLKFTPP